MRYIRLTEDSRSPYDDIIKYGCGPIFVLNRQHEFQMMIKSQGFRFWFRFWLTFCNHDKGNKMKKFDEEWPEAKAWACIKIHEEFLQGTQEKALDYCLNKAIRSLIFKQVDEELVKQYLKTRGSTQKQKFERLLQECSHMTFGAALCVVFHSWLHAKDINTKLDQYWMIPAKYQQPNHKPGTIEKYIVSYWEYQILPLLGLYKNKLPRWISDLLGLAAITSITVPILKTESLLYDDSVTAIMEIRKHYWRTRIKNVDEKVKETPENIIPMGKPKFVRERDKGIYKRRISAWKCEQWSEIVMEKFTELGRLCAFCGNSKDQNFMLCELCLNENWSNPRWYCSIHCQIEDWLQYHGREHAALSRRRTEEPIEST